MTSSKRVPFLGLETDLSAVTANCLQCWPELEYAVGFLDAEARGILGQTFQLKETATRFWVGHSS